MFNLCWTETHARTIVGRSYADPDFHENIKVIFLHVKAERDDKGEDIIRKADDVVIKACAVFLKESVPEDKTEHDANRALDLSKECNMLE
jgi:hypothetical protein